MATFVIDQNLKMRESQAFGTSEFLQDELTKMRARLEELEKALEEYRRVHMGELPEQLPSNLAILERLQQQLNQSYQSVRDDKEPTAHRGKPARFRPAGVYPSRSGQLCRPRRRRPKSLEGLRQQLWSMN